MRGDLWHRMAVRRSACVRALAFLAVIALSSSSGLPAADATGGTQLWVARYDVAQPAANDVAALGVSPDGAHVFVTGTISHADGANYRIVAYDASTGGEVWTKGFGPDGSNGRATALEVSPGGSTVFVTGWSYRTAVGGADYVTIAYDAASGTRLWTRHSPFLIGNGPDHPAMLGVSPDGSTVFLSGTSDAGPALFDYATVAYEAATGHRLWTARFDGGSRLR